MRIQGNFRVSRAVSANIEILAKIGSIILKYMVKQKQM